jgi:hypothetical protein
VSRRGCCCHIQEGFHETVDASHQLRLRGRGFLGMGEHHVAVDWGTIVLSRDGSGKIHARLNMTKAQLQAMPEYKFDSAQP